MLGSLILTIVLVILMSIAEQDFCFQLSGENTKDKEYQNEIWFRAVSFGVVVGLINYAAPRLPIFAPVFFILMICVYVYLILRWRHYGGTIRSLIMFVLIAFLCVWTMEETAVMTVDCFRTTNGFTSFLLALPFALMIGSIGYFIVDKILWYARIKAREATDGNGKVVDKNADSQSGFAKIMGYMLAIIVAILVLMVLFGTIRIGRSTFGWISGMLRTAETEAVTVTEEEAREAEVAEATKVLTVKKLTPEELETLTIGKYSGSDVLLQSSLSPYDKERTEKTGFSDALTFGFTSKEKEKMFLELEEEILRNPVYGVTVANAIRDKKIGSHRIGDLNEWLDEFSELNAEHGVAYWLEDRYDGQPVTGNYQVKSVTEFYVTEEYRIYAATLCTWLERLVPQGVHAWQTVENWCLNEAAKNNDRAGVPASYQYAKDALILSYVGKNEGADRAKGKDVMSGLFTIGFNVHDKRPEFYGDEPEDEPTPTTPETDKPDNPEPETEPGPGPTPEPETEPATEPTPKYNKDPNKAPKENTEPNDNPGPGPDTNNGKGAQNSTADQPTNSDHYSSYDEYKEDINDLNEINESQQQGGDSNEPSTPPPSTETTVDNNGGSANDPAAEAPPAEDAGTGETIITEPGDPWGGPPE